MLPIRIAPSALFATALTLIGAVLPVAAQDAPLGTIEVEGGLVQGVASDTEGVTAFLGVPYAGSVGGDNRWKPAPPVTPWDGVLVADKFGPMMLQDHDEDQIANDDGLVLNLWTPAKGAGENLPVYMLIYGGANRSGSNQSDSLQAAELAAKGIVVVSVQYRIGAPGFMALPEMATENPEGAAGNYGVLDLVDALHWIEENIESFGGDPETVTIGGQSSGAENTVALLRTPSARDLFNRAFVSSSFTGFLPGKVVDGETKMAQNQAAIDKLFGRPMTLADLRAITPEEWNKPLGDSKQPLYTQMAGLVSTGQFYTVDGVTMTAESIDLLQPGALDGIDIMIGQNADERTGLNGDPEGVMTPEEYRAEVLDLGNAYTVGGETEEVFDLYVPMTDLDAYRLWLRMQNDRMFHYVRLGAEYAKAHNENSDVWLYYWDHAPPGNEEGFRQAYHAADVTYFNSAIRSGNPAQRPWTDPDFSMQNLASNYLANFIKTGNPNGEGLPDWGQPTAESGGQFIRFHQGEAEMRTETIYPSRDAYHRARVLEGLNWTNSDIFGE